jgi:hypothetical protein
LVDESAAYNLQFKSHPLVLRVKNQLRNIMIHVNNDPHMHGYVLGPTRRVTATFESSDHMSEIIQSLEDAGFAEEQIEIYIGLEGARKLDFAAERHGFLARLKRRVEMIYADETDCLRKIEMTLERGGMAVYVFVGRDTAARQRALEVLKRHDPSEVVYWGYLAIQRLWVRKSEIPVVANAIAP